MKHSQMIWFIGMAILFTPVWAEYDTTLPKHYPPSFHVMGFVHNMDTITNTLSLDGVKYKMETGAKVFATDGQPSSVYKLPSGAKVGVIFEANTKGSRIIRQIWILPANFFVEPHAG